MWRSVTLVYEKSSYASSSCPDRNKREQLLAFPGDRQQRLQHYTLSDSDLAVIGERDLLPCHLFRFVS